MRTVTATDYLGLGLSPKTAYLYVRVLDRFEAELARFGADLMTCGPLEVARVVQTWRNSHSSRAQLRGALNHAWDVLGRLDGPIRAVRVPPKPRGRCRALEAEAATILERAAWDRADLPGLAVLLGLYAGLRRAEIAALRWEDVILDEWGRVTWLRVHGKGDLVADVPVHPALAEALIGWYRRSGYVFAGRYGGRPVAPATIWAYVRQVSTDAGLSEIPTHVLRHTALAEANDRSGDLRAVQEIARHSRPETTAGYTRVTSQRLRDVVSLIDYGREIRSA
jgi:integrase